MGKFNVAVDTRTRATSSIVGTGPAATHEGGAGAARDTKSQLFLLAVTNMAAETTFYENADARDARFEQLVRAVALEDPEWLGRFLPWLRSAANMRSASVVAACEAVKARLDARVAEDDRAMPESFNARGFSRRLIDAVCQRADEPGEVLAYWTSRFGRQIPKPVKRGVADAVQRLYTEYSLLKYDGETKGYRFGDVIDLVHPTPAADKPWQGALFRYALDRRHDRDRPRPEGLSTIGRREHLMAVPVRERRALLLDADGPRRLDGAGMTWEALAGWLQGPMDAAAWEAIIPSMGYMALLRNLRNFDQAGVSREAAARVAARLSDPVEVARSRQFPFRFYAAHKATAGSLRWGLALEDALQASLASVPRLAGRTLVLVDQSPSMFPGYPFSTPTKGDITWAERAALFGAAVALRAEHADLVGYGMASYRVPYSAGDAVLEVVKRFHVEDGTDTPRAMLDHWKGHDRVLIVTDEQTASSRTSYTVDTAVPAHVPVYTWNVSGYQYGHGRSGGGRRHTFGGLTPQCFAMVPLLEAGRSQSWPF